MHSHVSDEKSRRVKSRPHLGKGPAKIFRDISDWARAKRLPVCEKDDFTLEFAGARGWAVTSLATEKSRSHPISHLARDLAVLEVLKVEGRGKRELSILDWFGAPRNRSLTPEFPPNGMVNVNSSRRPVWVASKDALRVDFISAPDVIVQGDTGRWRGTARQRLYGCEKFDTVLVQDVYFDPVTITNRFGPESIIHLSQFSEHGNVYVCVRLFVGDAGADDLNGSIQEGVWFRDQKGLIVFSPDPESAPYASHPDANWLQHRHVGGVDITFLQKLGPYWLFRCTPAPSGGVELLYQNPMSPFISVVDLTNYRLFLTVVLSSWVLTKAAKHLGIILDEDKILRIPVCHELVVLLNPIFSKRVPSGPTLDSALYKVLAESQKIPRLEALRFRFPQVYRKVIEGSFLSVLHENREVQAGDMSSMRYITARSEKRLLCARATANSWISAAELVGKRRSHLGWGLAGLVIGSVGLYVVYKRSGVSGGSILQKLGRTVAKSWDFVTQGLGALGRKVGAIRPQSTHRAVVAAAVEQIEDPIMSELIHRAPESVVAFGIPCAQVGAAFYEELARWFFPTPTAAACGFEVGILWTLGMQQSAMINAGCHTLYTWLHKFGKQGVAVAVIMHAVWNFMAWKDPLWIGKLLGAETRPCNILQVFLSAHDIGIDWAVQGMSVVEPLPAGTAIKPITSSARTVPKNFRGKIKITVDQVDVGAEEALDLLSVDPEEKNVMYPILITNGLLYEPANNAKNLLVAVLWRTHLNPFSDCDPEETRHRRWNLLSSELHDWGFFSRQIENVPSLEECARLMGKRGERILRADELDQMGVNTRLWKTVSLKWNETLNSNKEMGPVESLKPRPIVNLDPIVHARMSGISRSIASVLHERLRGQVYSLYGVNIRVFFAAGYTQRQLNSVVQAMEGPDVVLAISGDDSVVSWGMLTAELGCAPYGECDQSQFDHAQDEGPQRIMAQKWMELMGVPQDFIDLCYACCSLPYTARMGRLRVKGVAGTQMPTGITMTTVLNSLSTLFMYMWIIRNRDSDFPQAARELGFKTKYQSSDDIGDLTFLRGWWRKTTDGRRCWMPLPSACLKLGKVLRDPVDICKFKHPKTGQTVRKTDAEAVRVVSHALASSYNTVPKEYPIFGPFLGVLRRLGQEMAHPDLHSIYESWRPAMDEENLDMEDCIEATLRRYGLLADDLHRVEGLLDKVQDLPALVIDPLFNRLREVDY